MPTNWLEQLGRPSARVDYNRGALRVHAPRSLREVTRPHAPVSRCPVSARCHMGWHGRQFRHLLRAGHDGGAVPVRRRGCRNRSPRDRRADRPGLAPVPARRAPRTAVRVPRARAVRAAPWPAVQPAQGAARSLRQGHRPHDAVGRLAVRVPPRRSGRRPVVRRPRQRPVRAAGRRHRPRVHLGRRPAAPDALARDGHLRAARGRVHAPAPARARIAEGHVQRAHADAGAGASEGPRGHGGRADARAPPRGRSAPGRARPDQLLGLQHARVLRARPALLGFAVPGRVGARVQDDGAGAARRGPRGDSGRRVQPHRRGQPPRPDPQPARRGQRGVLPPLERPALLPGLHRHRQHAQHAAPARPAAHHGQPALLGHRDARGRLPVRPGQRAGARAVRGGQARRVLRHHPSGPDHFAGEAHRRAVGPRRRRVPGRQLPGPVDRVERPLSRHGPPLLEGRRRSRLGAGDAAGGEQRPVRPQREAPGTRRSTSSRRTTASPCRIWSATTRSTTKPTARTIATASRTT